jgi:hypothetical protein
MHFDPELVELFLGSMDEVLEIKHEFLDHAHSGGGSDTRRLQ